MRSVLGRVAKGAKRFGEHVVGEAQKVAEEVNQTDSEVEALLQRLSGASMNPEYRREAVVQLKDMLADNPKAQLAFGSMGGVPLMVSMLQDDRDDVGLLRGALECCVHAMRPPPSAPAPPTHTTVPAPLSAGAPWGQPAQSASAQGGHAHGSGQGSPQRSSSYQQLMVPYPEGPNPQAAMQSLESQAAAINAELLARRPDNVLLLLALLEDEPIGINDFYVRYHTVQLLTVLLQTCAYKLQDAILSSRGVVRLMDMLAEKEVIRNEVLVLLVSLTHSNEEVQKIAAFEGAFDRVFHIVREEGGADGGVVVQDCLELLNNLLRANEANQRLFREMGYFSHLSQMLAAAVPAEGLPLDSTLQQFNADRDEGVPISHQKAAILLCALETVMLLVAPPAHSGAPDTQASSQGSSQANAAALLKHGMVEALLPLGLKHGGVASPAVSSQALYALAGIVLRGQAAGREKLGTSMVPLKPGSPPIPVLQAALRLALHNPDQSKRAAAEHLIHSFCSGNPEGQAALASTMTPSARGVAGVPATFGGELSAALKHGVAPGTSVEVGCRAASVLQHLLAGNPAVKERLLQLPVEVPLLPGAAPEFLLPRCLRLLSMSLPREPSSSSPTPALLILRLLIVWLKDCPPAIAQMLKHAGHLPLIVDALTGRQGGDSVHVQGLAAVLLGVCVVYGSASIQPQQPGPQQSLNSQAQSTPSELVLDALISRVGLSHFIAKLDALCADDAFVCASSASNLPRHITRAVAAAATTGGDSTGVDKHKQHQSLQPSTQSLGSSGVPIDSTFACLIHELDAEIRQHVLHAFARPRAGSKHVAASSPSELIASLPGFGDAQKLHTAASTLLQLGRAADELRAQNQALAEDMARMAQQQQQQMQSGSSQQPQAAQGDTEARAGAEQRASVAEAEVAAMRQHAELLAARLAQAEQDAAAAQEASANSFSHATKCEDNLNTLGQHCHALESQIRELQHLLAETQLQLQQQAQASQAQGGAEGVVPEAEMARRVEEAVAKAVADAEANNEEQLTDLLVCLGQEEQKVSALSDKLAGYGVDVNALLESIKLEGDGEEDELR